MRAPSELSSRPQVQVALALAEAGCRFVIVGGTARLLLGAAQPPRDLDVVVATRELAAFRAGLKAGVARTAAALVPELSPQRVVTSWSPIDVFVEDEEPRSVLLEVDGVTVMMAYE